jgi:hypothetical protein
VSFIYSEVLLFYFKYCVESYYHYAVYFIYYLNY